MFHKAIFRYPLGYSRSHRSFSHLYPCPRFLFSSFLLRTTFVITMERKDFSAKPKCEPATSHTCSKGGVMEAIPLQATFVFGLLRYARNDKNQDGHVVIKKTPRHDNLLLDRHTTFAMTSCLYTCPRFLRTLFVIAMERSDRSNLLASSTLARNLSLRTLKE